MNMDTLLAKAVDVGADIGMKILGAILLWIVGKWLIGLCLKIIGRVLEKRKVDGTVVAYLNSFMGVALTVVLVIVTLGIFGVQTTTFAAVLAAAGVAIGMAWSGMLANFAAGVFMLVLRPIKVGDFVSAGGVIGTVREVGILVTVIDTMDNVKTIVGNKSVFEGKMSNFTANPYRRVDLKAQLGHSVDHHDAVPRLQKALAAIPNVISEPAPDVEILDFNLAGPVLAVRPYCHNDHYWQVYFATNEAIRDTFGAAVYPVPENHYAIRKTEA